MFESVDNILQIETVEDLEKLIKILLGNDFFAEKVKFHCNELKYKLLENYNITKDIFESKWYIFIETHAIHISESAHDYVWISNRGLVWQTQRSKNKFVNGFRAQYTVVKLLMNEAIRLSELEDIYDVDSYNYEYLSNITSAIFNNTSLYFELFGKSYISLSDQKPPWTHKLSDILEYCQTLMFKMNHNDTIFNAQIMNFMRSYVDYIKRIPGNFKEQYVKYDSNEGDGTVIVFNKELLNDARNVVEISYDFIEQYEYELENFYLETGLYNSLTDRAETESEKNRIRKAYDYLINSNG